MVETGSVPVGSTGAVDHLRPLSAHDRTDPATRANGMGGFQSVRLTPSVLASAATKSI